MQGVGKGGVLIRVFVFDISVVLAWITFIFYWASAIYDSGWQKRERLFFEWESGSSSVGEGVAMIFVHVHFDFRRLQGGGPQCLSI